VSLDGENMQDRNLLFSTYDLYGTCEQVKSQISIEIGSFQADYLLSVSLDDVCDHLVEKYSMESPEIMTENIELINQGETTVPTEDFGRRINLKANYYLFSIPFTGDGNLFKFKASTFTYSPPSGSVNGNELHLKFVRTDHDVAALKQALDREISIITEHLEWIKNDITKFNGTLRPTILSKLEARKEKLLKDQGLVASLGIPMRQRKDAPTTYTTPITRKKITIPKPKASKQPFKPEPELEKEIYDQIIDTLQNMVLVMERSPHAFSNMGEEDLRTHFLVQLNGLYEGQATGETFNFEGKTDILIRVEGKNIFIAECKFWTGPKGLQETIDQLLGYLSWRDTKVAILLFNRNKDFTKVLSHIPETVQSHSNYKKNFKQTKDTEFCFVLKSNIDESRELLATLLAFDIPQ
jgi:hypothetical protein